MSVGEGVEPVTIDEPRGSTGLVRYCQASLVLLSWSWAFFPGFGLIDLDAAIPPGDPGFRQHWFHEGTWGALVTALIVVPLLATAVRPGLASGVVRQQVVLVSCFTVTALLCLDPRFLALPVGLGLSTWAWWAMARPLDGSSDSLGSRWWPWLLIGVGYLVIPLVLLGPGALEPRTIGILTGTGALCWWLVHTSSSWAGRARRIHGRSWALLVVAAVAAGPWMSYSSEAASYARHHDYTGSGIDRLVAQAAFPICLLALLTAAAIGWLPVSLATWPAVVAAAGFGLLAVWYPEHLGSPGTRWGITVLAWSACVAVVAGFASRSTQAPP